MFARRFCQATLIVAIFVCGVPAFESPACDQQPAAGTPAGGAPNAKPKTVDKIYVVPYALVVLMLGLGVLVVCHYRERKARPDLPQEMVAERLRQGAKAQPDKKSA